MRIWVTVLDEVDSGQVDENGDPILVTNPRGLDIDSAWSQWPVVDDDDQVQVIAPAGPAHVVLAKDLNVAPSSGRDFGDPTVVTEMQDLGSGVDDQGNPVLTEVVVSPFHTVPLGSTATNTIEDWIGMERGELAGSTRAECLRAITADQNNAIGCTWGPDKVGARVWPAETRRIRRFRRYSDRQWYNSLTAGQRTFIRNLTEEQKDTLRDTQIVDRAALLQSWNV